MLNVISQNYLVWCLTLDTPCTEQAVKPPPPLHNGATGEGVLKWSFWEKYVQIGTNGFSNHIHTTDVDTGIEEIVRLVSDSSSASYLFVLLYIIWSDPLAYRSIPYTPSVIGLLRNSSYPIGFWYSKSFLMKMLGYLRSYMIYADEHCFLLFFRTCLYKITSLSTSTTFWARA